MLIQPPEAVASILATFDARSDIYRVRAVERAIQEALGEREAVPTEFRQGAWAEWAAFALETGAVPGGAPIETHFRWRKAGSEYDGLRYHIPGLQEVDGDVVAYWRSRARAVRHPVLAARYADLAWDTANVVKPAKPDRDRIVFARLAIDSYIAASRLDDGSAWGDTHKTLGRALELAMLIRDAERTKTAVAANIEYVDRTSDDERIGTYCYLLDRLLPARQGPFVTEDQKRQLVERFERKLAAMSTPGSNLYADSWAPVLVGRRLAAFYRREGRGTDCARVLRLIAETQERQAKARGGLAGVCFLDAARQTYVEAGLREEAERVQREAQKLGAEASKGMASITAETEISREELEQILAEMMQGGLETAIERFAVKLMPRQSRIKRWMEKRDANFIVHKLLPTTIMAHGHIVAHMGQDTSDPDGEMVHETAGDMQLYAPFIGIILDRLIREGLKTSDMIEFLKKTPIFERDRLGLLERGIEAHFRGDYIQAIHILLPQIEHAIRTLIFLVGRPSNKPHRTARGQMQFKNLNDILPKDQWPVPGEHGENLRMYLLAALAHPKGANIRNEVAHGVWPVAAFSRNVSERVIHVLLAVATIRLEPEARPENSEPGSQVP